MEEKQYIIEHLKIIQGIINRLAGNSFILKGWSISLLIVLLSFWEANNITMNGVNLIILIAPIVIFWGLDAYFLWTERLFRSIYMEVCKKDKTDFSMNVQKHSDNINLWNLFCGIISCGIIKYEYKNNFKATFFSITLVLFYGLQFTLLIVYYFSY